MSSSISDKDAAEASSSAGTGGGGGSYIKSGFIDVTNRQSKEGSSAFSKAFTNLKKSEFYEETPPEPNTTGEPKQKPLIKPASKNSVVVNPKQRGNPILKFVRNVPWEYGEIVPDYEMGANNCALFLSLRYHNLNPNYIHERLKQLGHQYELRVLLVLVDVKEPHHELKQLTKICFLAEMTLMLAWSQEEAGRIIEVYKIYENKPPDMIMEKQDSNPYSMLIDTLTSVRSINRSDAMTLLSTFGSLEKIVQATEEELSFCPGMGPQKASKLYKVLHQKFKK